MIIGFTGTPGSGKTYDAVRKIVSNLKKARTVYTNIEGINEPACLEMIKVVVGMSDCGLARHLHFLTDEQLGNFWNHVEPGSLIVLDEVQNIFSSRNWQSQENIGMNAWASTHRHHGFDVVLITQDIMRLDTAVRSLVEWTYVYRKVNFFGSFVQKSYIRHAYAGENTSGQALGKNIRKYEDRIFRCYKSYVASDIKEVGIMKHTNVLKHPIFFVIPVVFVVFIVLFFRSGFVSGDLFGADQIIEKSGKEVSGSAVSAPSVPDSYSVHTPSIYRTSRDGRIVFSNRRVHTGAEK